MFEHFQALPPQNVHSKVICSTLEHLCPENKLNFMCFWHAHNMLGGDGLNILCKVIVDHNIVHKKVELYILFYNCWLNHMSIFSHMGAIIAYQNPLSFHHVKKVGVAYLACRVKCHISPYSSYVICFALLSLPFVLCFVKGDPIGW